MAAKEQSTRASYTPQLDTIGSDPLAVVLRGAAFARWWLAMQPPSPYGSRHRGINAPARCRGAAVSISESGGSRPSVLRTMTFAAGARPDSPTSCEAVDDHSERGESSRNDADGGPPGVPRPRPQIGVFVAREPTDDEREQVQVFLRHSRSEEMLAFASDYLRAVGKQIGELGTSIGVTVPKKAKALLRVNAGDVQVMAVLGSANRLQVKFLLPADPNAHTRAAALGALVLPGQAAVPGSALVELAELANARAALADPVVLASIRALIDDRGERRLLGTKWHNAALVPYLSLAKKKWGPQAPSA